MFTLARLFFNISSYVHGPNYLLIYQNISPHTATLTPYYQSQLHWTQYRRLPRIPGVLVRSHLPPQTTKERERRTGLSTLLSVLCSGPHPRLKRASVLILALGVELLEQTGHAALYGLELRGTRSFLLGFGLLSGGVGDLEECE